MKRFLVIPILALCLIACEKTGGVRTVQADLAPGAAAAIAAADEAFDFSGTGEVSYLTDAGDAGTVSVSRKGAGAMSVSVELGSGASSLWCYTKEAAGGREQEFTVPSRLTKDGSAGAAEPEAMVFCSSTMALSRENSCSGTIVPVTSAVVLDVFDSGGKWVGTKLSSVELQASGKVALTGSIKLNLKDSRMGELWDVSPSVGFDCPSGAVELGTPERPASFGAAVLPCIFTGTITVTGEGLKATLAVEEALTFQAGYVKHIRVDMAEASIEGEVKKHFPTRLGILGDSISTFKGMIPSSHRTYYPSTNAACSDVDAWEKTYWGRLINDYWHCELDVNSAWSGSCVAAGDPTVVRTPFVERCSLFKNPDAIILFGGTNDCQAARKIALGEFDFTSAPDALNKYARFREAYIWVIRTLQANYPEAQIICILGNHIEGEYGNSVKTIAEHFGLPLIDFRGDSKVTVYSELHPNAAGHARMAERIYEETLSLFQ